MTRWWTNQALRTKGLIVIAIPCVILLGVIVAVYAADAAESRTDAVVAHSTAVRTDIERTLALMDRAETLVRSYLIVPRREFLTDYALARQQVLDTLEQLAVSLERDVGQTARLRSAESLIIDRLKALDVVGRIPDPDGRFRERSIRTGQAVLESLRGTLGLMQEDAERVLAAQTEAAARQAEIVRWLLLLGGITGIGGGIVAALLFTTGLGDRMRRLEDVARNISKGTYTTRVPMAEDEIGGLAAGLRDAAMRLDETEQQLRSIRGEADAASRVRRQFLERLGSQLRVPINQILGVSQSLQMGRLDAAAAESVGQVVGAGRHLVRIANDLLDVSRIEAGTLDLRAEDVPADEAVRAAVAAVLPMAERGGVVVSVHERDFAGIRVTADRGGMVQVVSSLLSCAISRSRHGDRVDVTSGVGQQTLRVAIHDTGAGMTGAELDRVFEPFEQAGGLSRESTGLELYVARGVTAAMDGRLEIESQSGAGTVFRLELPLAGETRAAAAAPARQRGNLSGLSVNSASTPRSLT